MFTIMLSTADGEIITWYNVLDFNIKELTYMQYEIEVYYSYFPENTDKMIIDKNKLVGITINPELSKQYG